MSSAKLAVSEIFGPTIQGEGPSTGRLAFFLRLAGCNLSCEWCDTPFTWDWKRFDKTEEVHMCTVRYIVDQLISLAGPLVNRRDAILVCTGGEPLLQQRNLVELLEAVRMNNWQIEIETNGTRKWDEDPLLVDRFNVSPKLAHSGCKPSKRLKPNVLRWFAGTGKAVFKFVCQTPRDLEEVGALAHSCCLQDDTIWIMPEGIDGTIIHDRLQDLAERVIANGWNLTTRLHTSIWGNARGR